MTCALDKLSDVLLGDPPMPEYDELYDELEGDELPTVNALVYPEVASEPWRSRLIGAEGAGRVGVSEVAVT